jgi:Domain of unknown function (DUF4357)
MALFKTIQVFLNCPRKGAHASGVYDLQSGRLTVKKGAVVSRYATGTMRPTYSRVRRELIDGGTKVDENGVLRIVEDYPFRSASAAASVIEGGSRNGRDAWADITGKTLNSLGIR